MIFDDGQTQPDADTFRRETGVEDLFEVFGRDALAGVRDLNLDFVPVESGGAVSQARPDSGV